MVTHISYKYGNFVFFIQFILLPRNIIYLFLDFFSIAFHRVFQLKILIFEKLIFILSGFKIKSNLILRFSNPSILLVALILLGPHHHDLIIV